MRVGVRHAPARGEGALPVEVEAVAPVQGSQGEGGAPAMALREEHLRRAALRLAAAQLVRVRVG